MALRTVDRTPAPPSPARARPSFETWSWFFMRVSGLVLLFLATPFSQDPRHVRRIGLLTDYERDRHRPAGGLPTRTRHP